mmetsp:Transcript_32882/g.86887  ORF Transcript_32882/g.86887 Transcript_32882/m.86887 type:complete len:255 (-) Transcript_32882:36-800(-)
MRARAARADWATSAHSSSRHRAAASCSAIFSSCAAEVACKSASRVSNAVRCARSCSHACASEASPATASSLVFLIAASPLANALWRCSRFCAACDTAAAWRSTSGSGSSFGTLAVSVTTVAGAGMVTRGGAAFTHVPSTSSTNPTLLNVAVYFTEPRTGLSFLFGMASSQRDPFAPKSTNLNSNVVPCGTAAVVVQRLLFESGFRTTFDCCGSQDPARAPPPVTTTTSPGPTASPSELKSKAIVAITKPQRTCP